MVFEEIIRRPRRQASKDQVRVAVYCKENPNFFSVYITVGYNLCKKLGYKESDRFRVFVDKEIKAIKFVPDDRGSHTLYKPSKEARESSLRFIVYAPQGFLEQVRELKAKQVNYEIIRETDTLIIELGDLYD